MPASPPKRAHDQPLDHSAVLSSPSRMDSIAMYSDTIKDHAMNPRNRRALEHPDAVGESKYRRCGDKVKLYFRLRDDLIEDVSFTATACGPAVAAASLATTLLKGRAVDEALTLGTFELHDALGGLPASKRHAILLVLECLHEALEHKKSQT